MVVACARTKPVYASMELLRVAGTSKQMLALGPRFGAEPGASMLQIAMPDVNKLHQA